MDDDITLREHLKKARAARKPDGFKRPLKVYKKAQAASVKAKNQKRQYNSPPTDAHL
jgi:hypothetical protein